MRELNGLDNVETRRTETYKNLTSAFALRLVPGEDFIQHEDQISVLEAAQQNSPLMEKMGNLLQSVDSLAGTVSKGLEDLNVRVKLALDAQDEQHLQALQETSRKAVLPIPSKNVQELEVFLSSSSLHFDAAVALFTQDPHVLATKGNVAMSRKKSPSFPANVILRFLFTLDAIREISHREPGTDFGPATTDFIVTRSNFLMGSRWKKSEPWIMSRMRKSVLHYKKK